MIQIHRSRPLLRIGNKVLRLSPDEYALITTLGMMDNRVTPRDLLIDAIRPSGRLPSDEVVLAEKIYRLRRKVGRSRLHCRPSFGYILNGPVRFVDEL